MAQQTIVLNLLQRAIAVSHQFKWPIEGLALPEAFVLQRALWHRESPDSIARLLNAEVAHVQHAQALVEHSGFASRAFLV